MLAYKESIANNQNKYNPNPLAKQKNQKKWYEKKVKSVGIGRRVHVVGEKTMDAFLKERRLKRAERITNCAKTILFAKTKSGKMFVEKVFLCHDRACPICQWRKSLAWRKKLTTAFPLLQREHNLRFIFLTLTVKNCEVYELNKTIKKMNKAWSKLCRQRQVARAMRGYFRATEATKSKDDTVHPHFHAVIAVDGEYFSKNKNLYISQKEWVSRWKKALDVDYDPVVDVRAVYGSEEKVAAEAAKYVLKYSTKENEEIEKADPEWFVEYYEQLYNVRQYTTGGVVKKVLGEDVTEEEMIHALEEGEEIDELDEVVEYVGYRWDFKRNEYVYDPTITLETFQPPWTVPPF